MVELTDRLPNQRNAQFDHIQTNMATSVSVREDTITRQTAQTSAESTGENLNAANQRSEKL